MNSHEVINERNLEMHAVVARELRADPSKLEMVEELIEGVGDDVLRKRLMEAWAVCRRRATDADAPV